MTHHIPRRSLLAGASALAVGAAAAGCSTTAGGGDGGGGAQRVADSVLPNFIPSTLVEPDLVSTNEGGGQGFFAYPEDPKAAFDSPPLSGEKIDVLTFTFDPAPPSAKDNPLWQGVQEGLGSELNMVFVPTAEYGQRFATAQAGGDLPDLVSIYGTVQRLPDLLQAQFTDLTEYLAGDAIADYPHLAAIATQSWQKAAIGGKLWAVPKMSIPMGQAQLIREDIVEPLGLPMQPTTYEEFKELLLGMVDTKSSRWGSGDPEAVHNVIVGALGSSTKWTESGGKFLHAIENPEYEAALNNVQQLWKAGVFHPDSIGATNNQRNDWFTQGVTPMVFGGWGGWSKYPMWGASVPGFRLGSIIQFGYDASTTPVSTKGNVVMALTALKKAEPERIKTLLTALDWLAAPFGSQEYLLRKYGIEGSTYDLDGTDPILNQSGQQMRLVPFVNLVDAPQAIYDPGQQVVTQARFDYQEAVLPIQAPDPTLGLYSEAAASKENQLERALTDVRQAIMLDRAPVSAWAEAVDTWRSDGGDEIRAEYEQAFAAEN